MENSATTAMIPLAITLNRLRNVVYFSVTGTLVLTAFTGFLMYERIHDKIELTDKIEPSSVDGEWTAWTDWTACSPTCGSSAQARFRLCSNPSPKNGGAECVGVSTEMKNCSSTDCIEPSSAVDGEWTTWTDWTACSTTCGSGTQSRFRICSNPSPKNGGAECVGVSTEMKNCSSTDCIDMLSYNYRDEMAQSYCASKREKRYVFAVRKDCGNPANTHTCNDLCDSSSTLFMNLTIIWPYITVLGPTDCFDDFAFQMDHPRLQPNRQGYHPDAGLLNMVTFSYGLVACDFSATVCGPNYCCCSSA